MRRSNILRAAAPLLALLVQACASTQEAAPPPPPPAQPSPFAFAVGQGVADLAERADILVEETEALLAAIENRDLGAARAAYPRARAPYEELQVMRIDFPQLDRAIDGRPSDFVDGELDPDFTGFHAIEVALFARDDVRAALPLAERLYEDVQRLRGELRTPSQLDAFSCFQSMIERTGELAWDVTSGAEEPWSEATLTVIKHGWMGTHALYRHFAGPVRERNGIVGEQLDRTYRRALELIAEDFPVGGGASTPYNIITRQKRRHIADASLYFRARLMEAAEVLDLGIDG